MSNEVKTGAKMDTADLGLKKHHISVGTVVFMIFSLVAAGCYGIESMIPESGPGLTLVLLMVLPFIWGLPMALVASEMGSVRPQEGGYYKWVQEGLGEFWGFQAGWWRTVSIYIDQTLYVVLAGGYLASISDIGFWGEFAFKAAMILVFTYVNLKGIRDVGMVTTVISLFVIVAFGMVAVAGFTNYQASPFEPFFAYEPEGFADYFALIGGGLSIGMWMYSGYESMSTVAGELEDPQVIPKGTMLTIPLIMLTYILPTAGALSAMPELWDKWGETSEAVGYHTVAHMYWGWGAGVFFIAVAVIAQFSIYNTYIASGSRGFFALAEDNLAPPFMVKVSKKKGVPYVAVLSVMVVNLILCNLEFSVIIIVDVFMYVAAIIMMYIASMKLRRRIPKEEYKGKFRIPGGYTIFALVCIIPICVGFVSFLLNGTDYFIGGMIGIISGPILYLIWRKMYGGLTKKDPVAYPGNPKTGLAKGDTFRFAFMFFILGIIGVCGRFFLPWYEVDWPAVEYYQEEYAGIPFLSNWGSMLNAITIATILCFAVAIICYIIGKKVEDKK